MRYTSPLIALGALLATVSAEDLPTALGKYPEASEFAGLLKSFSTQLAAIFPTDATMGFTVLVPTNDAFASFSKANNGTNVTALPPDMLVTTLKYHIMLGSLTKSNFSSPRGLTVPTLLRDEQFNLRAPAPQLGDVFGPGGAEGQVLFVSKSPLDSGNSNKFRVRATEGDILTLRSGLASNINMTAVDGKWDMGRFQLIDTILTTPKNCSTTIRGQENLKSLDEALNKAELWDALDTSRNVTCLAPASDAFKAAGNPENKLSKEELTNALLFHTLKFPTYSNFLYDGQKIESLANITVTVTIQNDDIFFNDAKVRQANVLTNNGLVHVLDGVMTPNGTAPPANETEGDKPSGTGSGASSATSSGAALAALDARSGSVGGLVGVLLAGLALL